jgi:hypothetical protein
MPTEAKDTRDDKKLLDTVTKLIRLANDKDEGSEEARTAAMTVTKMVKENDLVIIPRAELERIKVVIGQANALARRSKEEAQQKMLMAGIAGLMASKVLKF